MKKNINILLVLLSVLGLCFVTSCGNKMPSNELLCYVGGTMRPAMEEIAKRYKEETGKEVVIDYAGSGELLIKIEQTGKGDLFVCHDPFLGSLMTKGLGDKGWTVAAIEPVIIVKKGNPKKIKGFRDLIRDDIKVVLTHPEYSTTGHIVKKMAAKAGITEKLYEKVSDYKRGGGGSANAVMDVTFIDASIVWNAVWHLRKEKLDVVPVEKDVKLKEGIDSVTSASYGTIDMDYIRVTIATLKKSKKLEQAREFAEYVVSDKGKAVWDDFGFGSVIKDRPHPAAQ